MSLSSFFLSRIKEEGEPAMNRNLVIGRIVHFRMPSGQWRPAIVVHVWGSDAVNLQVFTDMWNDSAETPNVQWETSVPHYNSLDSAAVAPYAVWRWPDEAASESAVPAREPGAAS